MTWLRPWFLNVPILPLIPLALVALPGEETVTGGQNPQQSVLAVLVFLQMMWCVVSPWKV